MSIIDGFNIPKFDGTGKVPFDRYKQTVLAIGALKGFSEALLNDLSIDPKDPDHKDNLEK